MNPVEIAGALDTMTALVDTREQDTQALRRRLSVFGKYEREKLDFGDYSAAVTLPDGAKYSLADKVAVERKMSLDELAACFTGGRARFRREFERAKEAGAKIYLLVESATWEKAYGHRYRSQLNPKAFIASMTAWLARYDCQIIFCQPETTGILIKEILYREMKERLEGGEADCLTKDG